MQQLAQNPARACSDDSGEEENEDDGGSESGSDFLKELWKIRGS